MNKWVNPPLRKLQNEVYISMPAELEKPFSFYLEQVGKERIGKKKKTDRIADKTVSLAERIGMQGSK